jgi:hypothetical protein
MLKKHFSAVGAMALAAAVFLAIPATSRAQIQTFYGNGSASSTIYNRPGVSVTTYYYGNPLFYNTSPNVPIRAASPVFYNTSPNIPVRTYSNAIYPYANSGLRANSMYTYVEAPYLNYVPTTDPRNPYYYAVSPYYNYVPSNNRAYPYSYASYPYVNYVPLRR